MSRLDDAESRAQIGALLRTPPAGAAALCLERYMKIPPSGIGGEILDQLLVDDDTPSARERPGRRVVWRDASGRELSAVDVHPIKRDFESSLLPHAIAAIAGRDLRLLVYCEVPTLTDPPREVERFDGQALLRPTAEESASREVLARHGYTVEVRDGATEISWSQKLPPPGRMMIFFLPLILPIIIPLLPLALVSREIRELITTLFRKMFRSEQHRFSLRITPDRIEMRYEASGQAPQVADVAIRDVRAVSFAPRRSQLRPDARGLLRLITGDRVFAVDHAPTTIETDRHFAIGEALANLLRQACVSR